jgi:hypothetical protein
MIYHNFNSIEMIPEDGRFIILKMGHLLWLVVAPESDRMAKAKLC